MSASNPSPARIAAGLHPEKLQSYAELRTENRTVRDALATERGERRVDAEKIAAGERATKACEDLRSDRNDLLDYITELHAADKDRPACIHCDGSGEEPVEVGDAGGYRDIDQPTHFEIEECSGCRGTGHQWDWKAGVAS